MLNKTLHIVSFDVPYPPNYGGAIDVFYKIKSLHKIGVHIILHTFEYGRKKQPDLEKYCKEVIYYSRKTNLIALFSKLPFIVKTRNSKLLLKNLNSDKHPILFEALHTTYFLKYNSINSRNILVRTHNIEHNYYKGLYKSESNFLKKIFFFIESIKLRNYQKVLEKASHILTISPSDFKYYQIKHQLKAHYIPAFHSHTKIHSKIGTGNFALYHGDLKIADNIKSCLLLVKIFSNLPYPLTIASSTTNNTLLKEISKYKNIQFIKIINHKTLTDLIQNAHLNILPTFQNSGIKLKLINALYLGRFCLVNKLMVENTVLENYCFEANTIEQFQEQITSIFKIPFTESDQLKRKEIEKYFNVDNSAKKILNLIS